MGFSDFLKGLKKRLRRRKHRLALGIWVFVIAGAGIGLWAVNHADEGSSLWNFKSAMAPVNNSQDGQIGTQNPAYLHLLELLQEDSSDKDVVVRKVYICGTEEQTYGRMSAEEILHFYDQNKKWDAEINHERILFTEQVPDLSPQCKKKAHFGIDKNGNFSLFDGMPRDEKVLRTFFQLNIGQLKSSLPEKIIKQLYDGIRVSDVAEYNSVLSTFSDFAVEEAEKVIQPIS